MPDTTKPITAQEAVEAYNTLRNYCKMYPTCRGCLFDHQGPCPTIQGQNADHWPDIKEAPDA